MKEVTYKKAIKRLVFLEDNFSVNTLPIGFTVKEYTTEILKMRKIVKKHLNKINKNKL